ncbi:hypothetical protein VTN77DRAFT_3570 [Rasamsonia byssochlamydoides]|uniref:uncharacterized protein n=1 Tax=Rasamsonia byssochlamydoides TaxID=89139 RepID=UPI003743FB80
MTFLSSLSSWSYLLLLLGHLAAGKSDEGGYLYGQPVPVSCLNRTIDSGEHIEDNLGRLQYIPFPTCNETSLPLAFRYGISETITCTIDALPDTLYHLFEYYVHSDVPLACRVPTGPLTPAEGKHDASSSARDEFDIIDVNSDGGGSGPPYTPLTIALQGTLQLSHLHIWTDMNVIMHQISSVESPRKKSKKANTTPGYVVAGTAYSVPELHSQDSSSKKAEDEDAALIENARNPWTAGHGSKVIRGEPLTLRFRVSWVTGADSLGWTTSSSSSSSSSSSLFTCSSSSGGLFSKVIFFITAAGLGALAASYWERHIRRGGVSSGWKGDGILGRPSRTRRGSTSGVTYGNGGRMNGYGGFVQANTLGGSNGNGNGGGGGYGFGGYGKKD